MVFLLFYHACTYLGEKSLSLKYNIGTSLDLNYMCSYKIYHYYTLFIMIVRL